ncbi:histidine ammonia-lyase, partial [Bacillus sp. mrc49]
AVEYRGTEKMAPFTKDFYTEARKIIPSITQDRVFAKDIEAAASWLLEIDWNSFIHGSLPTT